MAIFQQWQQPIVTDLPSWHSKTIPNMSPLSIPKGGGGPPQINPLSIDFSSVGGGGVILILSIFSGGWRTLSFDISILARGQINSQPTPIFVNQNSSFALPELAFVNVKDRQESKPRTKFEGKTTKPKGTREKIFLQTSSKSKLMHLKKTFAPKLTDHHWSLPWSCFPEANGWWRMLEESFFFLNPLTAASCREANTGTSCNRSFKADRIKT